MYEVPLWKKLWIIFSTTIWSFYVVIWYGYDADSVFNKKIEQLKAEILERKEKLSKKKEDYELQH